MASLVCSTLLTPCAAGSAGAAQVGVRWLQADLSDMNYQSGPPSSAGLVYEKRMLDRWLKAEFAVP